MMGIAATISMVGAAQNAVPVAFTGASAIMSLVTAGGIVTIIGGAIVAWIRIRPAMSKLAIDDKASIRSERRNDLSVCHGRIDTLAQRLDICEAAHQSSKMQLLGTLVGYRILEATHHDPAGIEQARAAIRAAFAIAELPENITDLLRPLGGGKE